MIPPVVRDVPPGALLVEVVHEGGRPATGLAVDLETDLSAAGSDRDGRHPLPTPEAFAHALGRAGIGVDDVVVAHDDAGGVFAARLVWMLRAIGQDAALLDGPAQRADPARQPVRREARPWPPELLATADEAAGAEVLVDARPADRFAGAQSPLDPRPGHVPGARSLPCRENLDGDGRLLPDDVLRDRFTAAGVRDEADVVAYCGSGVTACHNLLVAEHLGLGRHRLYVGSWSQWASDPDRPVEL